MSEDENPQGESSEELPTEPVYLVRITKSGSITIPKEIRDNYEDKTPFALLIDGNKLIFQKIAEADVDKLNLVKGGGGGAAATGEPKEKRKSAADKKAEAKMKDEGFDPASYLVYEFENSDKVLKALELSWKQFADNDLEQALNYVKVAIVKYVNGKSQNDARLYYSVILYLCDVITKLKKPNLIEYIRDNIIPNIDSKILKEQSLAQLISVSIQVGRIDKAKDFADMILDVIKLYKHDELFFLMDSLKQLVRTIRVYKDVPKDVFENVKNRLLEYANGITIEEPGKDPVQWEPFDIDYKIQIIDMLEQLRFIEEAFDLADTTRKSLPEDSMRLDEMRKIANKLKAKPIE